MGGDTGKAGCGGPRTGTPALRAGCDFTLDNAQWSVWEKCRARVGSFFARVKYGNSIRSDFRKNNIMQFAK
jgi:hypothetical protein